MELTRETKELTELTRETKRFDKTNPPMQYQIPVPNN
jgi:hypothetical protein